jgi:hypothetical protein
MIRLLSILILSGSFLPGVFSQESFSLTPNPSKIVAPPTETDAAAHSVVKNLTGAPLNMRWERTIILLPPGVQSQICDPVACYLPSASAKNFVLAPNAEGILDAHFLNSTGQPQEAIVHLLVKNLDNPGDQINGVYTYSSVTSATMEPTLERCAVYPNPTSGTFSLLNADLVSSIRLFNMDGKEIGILNANSDNQYNITHYLPGQYILALLNNEGRLLKALSLLKK